MTLVLRWTLLALAALAVGGCKRCPPPRRPTTAAEAAQVLANIGREGDARRLFEFLDQESRWSMMTIYRDQRAICSTVRAQYPKERQARELQRCSLAERSSEVGEFFAAYVWAHRLLAPLAKLDPQQAAKATGDRVELGAQGSRVTLCRDAGVFAYCGLRTELEQLKVKTSRDLETVKENGAAFKAR